MFINIKLGKLFKIFFIIVAIVIAIFFLISVYRIIIKSGKSSTSNKSDEVIEITVNNYTNVLKAVHDNIDEYIGKKIKFTGYIYRVFDLTDTQFVLARNMIINSNNQAVIVGFLCNSVDASNFSNNTWVEVTGIITKGNYHGDMPIIEAIEINSTDCPNDEFVYPPDDSFIPTNSIV